MIPTTRLLPIAAACLWLAACASTPPVPPMPVPVPQPVPSPVQPTQPDPGLPNRPAWRAPPMAFPAGTPAVERIVQVALREHAAWYRPFIDTNGRLASRRVAEAERSRLDDGSEAWERVVAYWRDSGTLGEMQATAPGASLCQNPFASTYARSECRVFVIDTPWSAAFVSYVMLQAGIPGFRASPRHADYIRAAHRGSGPYGFEDPNLVPVARGDMLCYIRNNPAMPGHGGLSAFLAGGGGGFASHCDIAVQVEAGEAWLVGGNVANMVTMRKLRLDAQGRAQLPRPIRGQWVAADEEGQSPACSPSNEAACSMNRQNWAVLLKLRQP